MERLARCQQQADRLIAAGRWPEGTCALYRGPQDAGPIVVEFEEPAQAWDEVPPPRRPFEVDGKRLSLQELLALPSSGGTLHVEVHDEDEDPADA
jgi:hypothetical protein